MNEDEALEILAVSDRPITDEQLDEAWRVLAKALRELQVFRAKAGILTDWQKEEDSK
jgi:hypothetical protein